MSRYLLAAWRVGVLFLLGVIAAQLVTSNREARLNHEDAVEKNELGKIDEALSTVNEKLDAIDSDIEDLPGSFGK